MRIAHIHALAIKGEKFRYFVDYLNIIEEKEKYYVVEDHDKGIEPRGNFLSKESDYEATDDGYASINMPGWIRCNTYEVSGVIYVLEDQIDNGKLILQQALLETIDKHIQKYEETKALIQKG